MMMLEASDAIATSTNLLNLLPTEVRSLPMFRGRPVGHPVTSTVREHPEAGDGRLPALPGQRYRAHEARAGNVAHFSLLE